MREKKRERGERVFVYFAKGDIERKKEREGGRLRERKGEREIERKRERRGESVCMLCEGGGPLKEPLVLKKSAHLSCLSRLTNNFSLVLNKFVPKLML